MPTLYWNPVSVNALIILILQCMITGYFIKRLISAIQHKVAVRSHSLLCITFLALFICTLLFTLSDTLHRDDVDWVLPWITPAASIATAAYLMFAFYFLEKPAANKRWAFILGVLLFSVTAYELFIGIQRWQLLHQGSVVYRAHWTEIPNSALFLISSLLYFIHLLNTIHEDQALALSHRIKLAVVAICKPLKKLNTQAAAARAFFYYSLFPISFALLQIAQSVDLIGWRTMHMLGAWAYLGILSGFVLVYLNYIPTQSSFRIKLVGLTLMTVLSILIGIVWLIDPPYSQSYVDETNITQHSAIRFTPDQQQHYQARNVHYLPKQALGKKVSHPSQALKLPFSFAYYGNNYQSLYAHPNGIVGFDHLPSIQNVMHEYGTQAAIFLLSVDLEPQQANDKGIASGLYFDAKQDHVTLTWHKMVAKHAPQDHYSFQLTLYANGTIDMVFIEVPAKPRYDFYWPEAAPMMTGILPEKQHRKIETVAFATALPITLAANTGVIQDTRTPFLQYQNAVYRPIAYFILVAVLFILVIYPRFFYVNLDGPLQALLKGVQHIMNGRLDTQIKVFYLDEFGYIAKSFNQMANAQAQLVATLEDKIAKRTAEASKLAAENARLEERNHLSRELHDTVSQTLFSSNLLAEKIPELTQEDPKRALQALTEIQALNRNALLEMRHLLLSLNPDKIAGYHFGKLLQDAVHEIEQKFSCAIKVSIDNDVILPIDIQLTFYRIAQECLNNAAKYAGTKQLAVYFDGVANQAMLTVSDQGQGFDPQSVPSGHLGLKIMRERMQDIGGSLEVLSQPSKGTTVTAIWIQEDASTNH